STVRESPKPYLLYLPAVPHFAEAVMRDELLIVEAGPLFLQCFPAGFGQQFRDPVPAQELLFVFQSGEEQAIVVDLYDLVLYGAPAYRVQCVPVRFHQIPGIVPLKGVSGGFEQLMDAFVSRGRDWRVRDNRRHPDGNRIGGLQWRRRILGPERSAPGCRHKQNDQWKKRRNKPGAPVFFWGNAFRIQHKVLKCAVKMSIGEAAG